MARVYREVRQTRVQDTAAADGDEAVTADGMTMVARLVYLLGGAIVALLGLRFILAMLGANPANAFANFVYSLSGFFAAPFFGLFNYHSSLGIGRFEYETLIAIIVYSLLTWFIVRLLSIGNRYEA